MNFLPLSVRRRWLGFMYQAQVVLGCSLASHSFTGMSLFGRRFPHKEEHSSGIKGRGIALWGGTLAWSSPPEASCVKNEMYKGVTQPKPNR